MNTKILSIHVKREVARERQREIQTAMDTLYGGTETGSPERIRARKKLDKYDIPGWARGVRVDTAVGGLLHTLRATENRGT